MSSNEQLSKEKENKLKDIFYLVDQDKDNKIDTNEVGVTLRALGIYLSQEDISQITKEIDPSGCGKVTYEQFKDLYITKLSTNKKVNDLVKAFKSFDKENKGVINLNELKHGLTVLGEPLSDYEIELLMEEANCDENGNVDYIKLSEKIFGEKYTNRATRATAKL